MTVTDERQVIRDKWFEEIGKTKNGDVIVRGSKSGELYRARPLTEDIPVDL